MTTTNPIYVRGLAFLDQQIAALNTPEGLSEARLLLHQLADELPADWIALFLDCYRAVLEEHMATER